jgi:hypothetical protein
MVAATTADANDAWPFKTARERVLRAMEPCGAVPTLVVPAAQHALPAPKTAVQKFSNTFFKDHLESEVTPRPRAPIWTADRVSEALWRLHMPSGTMEEAWTASGPLRISAVMVQSALAEARTPLSVARILDLMAAVATCRARDGRLGLCASSHKRNPFMQGQELYAALVGTICAQARPGAHPTAALPTHGSDAPVRPAGDG